MAAYASTVTLGMNKVQRIRGTNWGFIAGTIDITNYNATTTEETGITKHFKSYTVGGSTLKCFLITEGTTDNGYAIEIIPSTGKFKAWKEASAGPAVQASDDTDVGAANFWAVGLVY